MVNAFLLRLAERYVRSRAGSAAPRSLFDFMGVLLLWAVSSQMSLFAAVETVSLGDRDMTSLAPGVSSFTTSVLALAAVILPAPL